MAPMRAAASSIANGQAIQAADDLRDGVEVVGPRVKLGRAAVARSTNKRDARRAGDRRRTGIRRRASRAVGLATHAHPVARVPLGSWPEG